MKNQKTLILALSLGASLITGAAHAAPTSSSGRITLKGSIVNTPCSSPSGDNPILDFGQISKAGIDAGHSTAFEPLEISFEDCQTAINGAKITFKGKANVDNSKILETNLSDLGMEIKSDLSGEAVEINQETDLQPLNLGANKAAYKVYPVGYKSASESEINVGVGSFNTAVDYTIEYP